MTTKYRDHEKTTPLSRRRLLQPIPLFMAAALLIPAGSVAATESSTRHAAPAAIAEPESVGMSAERLSRITDTLLWTPGFEDCVATRLGAELAHPITESARHAEGLWKEYGAKLQVAEANDGRQGRSQRTRATALTAVR